MTQERFRELMREALPPPIAERAIANQQNAAGWQRRLQTVLMPASGYTMLVNAFSFADSEEGYPFWAAVRDHLSDGNPLPKI